MPAAPQLALAGGFLMINISQLGEEVFKADQITGIVASKVDPVRT